MVLVLTPTTFALTAGGDGKLPGHHFYWTITAGVQKQDRNALI